MLSLFNLFSSQVAQVQTQAVTATLSNVGEALVNQAASEQEVALTPDKAVWNEMNNRATNFWYTVGRLIGKAIGTVKDDDVVVVPSQVAARKIKAKKQVSQAPSNATVPYDTVYRQLFSQDKLRVLYVELDPGVDDAAAVVQLISKVAANKGELPNGKKIEMVGFVPCAGNAVLSQTELNTMRLLTLMKQENLKVYPGEVAPLAIQNNQTAINQMEAGINATHFYGYDGLSDVGGWPNVSMSLQSEAGYLFSAEQIVSATPESALTLVSTSDLTALAKTLQQLDSIAQQRGLPKGAFAKNINAISIMGGCINPAAGCNAPFNVPDNQKNSEANFYFDTPATQIVFDLCQEYGIPIILSPLDLTQQSGLLWTKTEVDGLNAINNPVAKQMAKVTGVVPYLDAPCFTPGEYPMHDLQAAANLIYPEDYEVQKVAVSIGNVGQVTINGNATEKQKNVYILSMPVEKQLTFYNKVIADYKTFGNASENKWKIPMIGAGIAAGAALLGLGSYLAYRKVKSVCKEKQEVNEDATERTGLVQTV